MKNYKLTKKTNGIYVVSFYDGDVRRRISTGTRDPKTARQTAPHIVNGTHTAQPSAPSQTQRNNGMTMGELFGRCSQTVWSPRNVRSQRTVKSNIKILSEMIGDEPVTSMNYPRLSQLVSDLFARGYAAGTVHRKMCAVSKALNEATRMTDTAGRPILAAKVSIPTVVARNSRSRVLTRDEEAAIFDAIAARSVAEPTRDWQRFARLLRFLLDTGCRLGEALNVSDALIETHDNATFVTFPRYTTKNEKPRKLPLTQAIVSCLPYLRAAAIGGKLFPLKSQTVWYMWKGIRSDLVANGVPVSDVVLHTMRHTFLTRLAQSGKVPLERISEWAGHSSLQVTMDHYLHLMPVDKLSTLDVVEAIALQNAIQTAYPTKSDIAA